MAQGQIITAGTAAVAGAKSAPMLRAMAPGGPGLKTAIVAGGGIGVAALGTWRMRATNGAGYAGPAMIGFGVGATLGAVSDHLGF